MDAIDGLEQAWDQGGGLVKGLRSADLSAPTPCAGWQVRDLLNHVFGEAQMMTEANRGQAEGTRRGDLVGTADPVSTWQAHGRDNVASWRESGVDGERVYAYGTFPAAAGLLINLGEVLVHNWDLAVATGQDCELDEDLAGLVLALYDAIPLDQMRAGGQLGPEVPVPADAPVADRMLGLLGRSPLPSAMPAIARAAEAETVPLGRSTMQLLLDAGATNGALSAHRVHLAEGEIGANPHRHTRVSEVLFVLDGSIDVLAGERLLTATSGDLVVIPPGRAHAFAASPGRRADLLVMITPGFDRFEYFRALSDAITSVPERTPVMATPPAADTYRVESTEWSAR